MAFQFQGYSGQERLNSFHFQYFLDSHVYPIHIFVNIDDINSHAKNLEQNVFVVIEMLP